MREFLGDVEIREVLDRAGVVREVDERLELAGGAPGVLLAAGARGDARDAAEAFLAALESGRQERVSAAFTLGGSKARGFFSEVLDALTLLLHQRAQDAVARGDRRGALRAIDGVDAVERAKTLAAGNVNPQLIGAALIQRMRGRAA